MLNQNPKKQNFVVQLRKKLQALTDGSYNQW